MASGRKRKAEGRTADHEAEPEVASLVLDGFDSHGTTRARWHNQWIEVEHGIPGETAEVEISGGRRPRGRILRLLDPSPDRVVPPCVYFREWQCGGCQWQHMAYPAQVGRKVEAVDAAMAAEGLLLAVTATHSLDEPWRYRTTAGIALGRRAGFRRHASLAIVPIRDCPISHPLIGRLMAALNEAIDGGRLPDFRGRARLDVRVAGAEGEERLQVLIRLDESWEPDLAALQRLIDTVVAQPEVEGVALQRTDRPIEIVREPLFAPTQVAGRPIELAAASFFQTNLRLLPRLVARLREEVGATEGRRIADLYGGVGVFGLFLADGAAEVLEVESDELAVRAGRRTAERWGLANVRFSATRVESGLPAGESYDVVIVDPPRSGLSTELRERLCADRPPLVLYVSCLAQSLARDLADFLIAGYTVDALELFDFYPQTYHVELLAVLRRPTERTSAAAD